MYELVSKSCKVLYIIVIIVNLYDIFFITVVLNYFVVSEP